MGAFAKGVAALSRFFGVVAALMIVLSVLVVCQMVFVRAVLGQSTIWQTPFVTYLLVGATFLGSPYVLLLKGHVNVDLLPLYLPHPARKVLAFLAAALSLAFCLLLFVKGVEFWHEAYVKRWTSSSVWRIPLWIPYLSLPLGMGLICLQYLADIYNLATGKDLPFGLKAEERL